ncbi:recombination-associated protein RdgC [mine drainage metagenome]|uniref:Recombination-associated protein RdgC n=1 Tax=mine drainage metagenome TaxID=410659 RepID=A0A1J5RB60_9ZZZZ
MWFKNLTLYRVPDWQISAGKLEAALARQAFQGCGQMDMESRGWVAPRGEGDALVHALGRQLLIALCVEQKLLPAAVITQYAKARAEEIEAQQGSKPGRKQLREIRERIADELLPRAFTRRRVTHAWIDPVNGWLVIDAANQARAEEVLEALRKSLDELPLALVNTRLSPMSAMTAWLAANEAPAGFTIDRDCEMLAPGDEKATVRYLRHPLEAQEVRAHIEEGKQVTKLALTWNERISFLLHENLQVKRLAFLDILKEQSEHNVEAAGEQFDADFAIMAGELARFLPELVTALGGIEDQAS